MNIQKKLTEIVKGFIKIKYEIKLNILAFYEFYW